MTVPMKVETKARAEVAMMTVLVANANLFAFSSRATKWKKPKTKPMISMAAAAPGLDVGLVLTVVVVPATVAVVEKKPLVPETLTPNIVKEAVYQLAKAPAAARAKPATARMICAAMTGEELIFC